MAGAAKSRFGLGWTAGGAALCLVLAGCAAPRPPAAPQAPPAPMVTPRLPPSSPEFNAATAKPLPVPEPPAFKPLPVPAPPGPMALMTPLPRPAPLEFAAVPVPAPGTPAQQASPMPRPQGAPARLPSDGAEAPTAATAAALPPPPPPGEADEIGVAGGYRLLFAPGSAEPPATAAALLREIADTLARQPTMRLRVAAYAAGEVENPVPARRLSLQRALKVREALAGEGIASLRVDIQALGLGDGSTPRDRVDLIPIQ